ncbi:MAG TPA: ComEC/Rec2 family competence protein [Candidatus Paceibacterota bacterium]|nr:ComEC/Rec2 family competence protein [Candidatus Paceibacterota bacterium]
MDDRKIAEGSPIKISIAGWLAGMLAASLFRNSFIYIMPIATAVGIFIWPSRRKGDTKSAYILFLLFAALAMFRFAYTDSKVNGEIASLPFDQSIELVGMVTASSEASTNGSQFIVKGVINNNKENIKNNSNNPQEIKFQVRESEGREYSYGDMVVVAGKIEKPEPFETSTGGMFDYPNFLKKDGILGIVKAKTITVTEKNKGNPILRTLLRFENNLENVLKTLIPEMKGSLSSGVLLGDKQITKENRDEFITTGTTHIIALSGYNVSIVANFFKDLFSFLPLAGALAMGGFAIVLFVVMTGLQSSAVRAGIMGCIVLFAKAKGRQANIGLVLMLAAFVMTAINPYTLYYDVSSQLSFLATVGIIYFAPTVLHWFTWVPEKKFGLPWREIAAGTIGTQMFVLPYILYKTGVLSIISPITNIAVLPFMPYLMAFAAVVAIVGIVYLPLAMPFALIAEGIAGAILFIIHISTKVPLAAVPFVTPFWAMALMYIFLLYRFDPFGWRKKP